MNRTLAEQMAIEVLKGDMVAARALADKLMEGEAPLPATGTHEGGPIEGYALYHWPEFQAFAKRLGFRYDLRTVGFTISCESPDAFVQVHQHYIGIDTPSDSPAVDTTTLHNQEYRTAIPRGLRE